MRHRLREPNPLGGGMIYSQELMDRVDNWRRFFRITQKIVAVPYYTPPELGDVMDEERIVKLPVNLQDAVTLELVWRNLHDPAKKWFIKWEHINRIPQPVIWRKLKHYNVRLKNQQDHQIFNRAALSHFGSLL